MSNILDSKSVDELQNRIKKTNNRIRKIREEINGTERQIGEIDGCFDNSKEAVSNRAGEVETTDTGVSNSTESADIKKGDEDREHRYKKPKDPSFQPDKEGKIHAIKEEEENKQKNKESIFAEHRKKGRQLGEYTTKITNEKESIKWDTIKEKEKIHQKGRKEWNISEEALGRKIDIQKQHILNKQEDITKIRRQIKSQQKKVQDQMDKIERTTNRLRMKNPIKKLENNGLANIMLESATVQIKRFNDYRPNRETVYFSHDTYDNTYNNTYDNTYTFNRPKNGMAIGIPFFNEPSHELQQTLNSLYNSWESLRKNSKRWRDKPLYVLIIQDGWHKAHPSMKEYLKKMFPKKIDGIDWWDYYDDFQNMPDGDVNMTYIFEKKDIDEAYAPVPINTQKHFHDNRKYMNITLLVKIDNRRKHNSHEWFLGRAGFAEVINAEYLFLTDAFTLFNETCLYHLIDFMDKHPDFSVATGRQRVMNREQQGSTESVFSLGYCLRMVQLFDFELANAVYNGAFSIGGCLPVVPGPCGLYRAKDILTNSVRDWYFDVVNKEPGEIGMVLGNLRIAEDRILSYSSVMKTPKPRNMGFVNLAVFYFEAETKLKNFILQRRRWINGSVAGYIYLLFTSTRHFQKWKTNPLRKLYIWLLLFFQFLIYFSVSIAPAFTITILSTSTQYLLESNNIKSKEIIILPILFWVIFATHMFLHNRNRFISAIMYTLLLLSMITSVVGITAILYYVFVDSGVSLWNNINAGGYIVYLALFVLFGPFILAFFLSGRGHSSAYMFKAFIPYLLFIHMLISWFGSYSFSRTWDLSWGNRPASEIHYASEDEQRKMKKKFKQQSIMVILGILSLNAIVYFALPRKAQLAVLSVFFIAAAFQMLFSIMYMITRVYDRIRFIFKKCHTGCSKKEDKNKSSMNIDKQIDKTFNELENDDFLEMV